MRSSNPVFSSLTKTSSAAGRGYTQAGYDQMGYGAPHMGGYGAPIQTERAITVDDVISKTSATLGVIIGFAVVSFAAFLVAPAIGVILTIVGALGGLITVLVATFGKKYGSAAVTLIYAMFEGLFVGGFSFLIGGGNGAIVGQAVVATVGVFIGMLWVYKAGVIRVTPKFTRFMTAALMGVLFAALGNLLMTIAFGFNPLRGDGLIAIGFSLVCIVLASLSFLQDFDMADQLVRSGAPAKMAWGVALGLAVTLVWLYTEILRLLSILRD